MGTVLLVLVVVLVIAGLVYGVVTLLAGDDPGLYPADPDSRARPLPNSRSLTEHDLKAVRFDVGLRGYRMAQVDRVLRRTAYDIGYKDEMIAVLEAEVIALREGRAEDAELLRKAREAAAAPPPSPVTVAPSATVVPGVHRADADETDETHDADLDVTEDDVDDEMDDATAPGKLNRAALRRVEDPTAEDDSEESSADATETTNTAEAPVSDGDSEAQRRART
jgi:DivIVA domain-containing protein